MTKPRFEDSFTQSAWRDAFFLGQRLADLAELFRLQDGIHRAVLGPEVEMLGQPVGGADIGELLRRTEIRAIVGEHASDRIGSRPSDAAGSAPGLSNGS